VSASAMSAMRCEEVAPPGAELGAEVGFTMHLRDGDPPDRAVGHQASDLPVPGSCDWLSTTWSVRPAASAAWISSSAVPISAARGFSQSTCFPAPSAAWTVWAWA